MSIEHPPVDYQKLRQDLARAVGRVCPRWLADRRDDLVQASMIKVMALVEAHPTDGEENPRLAPSYLYKVAHSALIDEIRRVRRRQETALEDEAVAAPPVSGVPDPERQAASREIGRGILDCLAQMAPDRRSAVTLHLQGHGVSDAARILDWAVKRTENLVYRGLADLRACLQVKGLRP